MTQITRFGIPCWPTTWRDIDFTRDETEPADGRRTKLGLFGTPWTWRDVDFESGTVKIIAFTATISGDYEPYDEWTIRVPYDADLTADYLSYTEGRQRMPIDKIIFSPRTLASFNEGSIVRHTVRFQRNGVAATPESIRYRVDDDQSGEEVIGWTTVTAAASVTIDIDGDDNGMIDETKRRERRTLTVEVDEGTEYEVNDFVQWDVLNRYGK